MKTAGVVLDFYDDPTGQMLKETFPDPNELPAIIKEAHILNQEERDVLRDEAYALVLVNEGKVLRKFACVDRGNVALSALYFLKTHDRLPEEAVKTAAENLARSCDELGVPGGPTLRKIAAANGMARKRDSFGKADVGDDNDWATRTNILSHKGGRDGGRVLDTVSSMKTAEAVGPGNLANDVRHITPQMKAPDLLQKKPQLIVDVTGREPERRIEKRASQHTALNGRYSLDSYSDVKKAVEYFSDYWTEMSPADRHEYAVKTAARADALGIEVPELLGRYGSTDYAPDVEAHLATRRMSAPEWKDTYQELQEKRASVSPSVFVEMLEKVDRASGLIADWGGGISDPYLATFGGSFEKKAGIWSWMSRTGDYISEADLMKLIENGRQLLAKHFPNDVIDELMKNPTVVFDSLPDFHKQIITRLATN
jgi:hypothetical protein